MNRIYGLNLFNQKGENPQYGLDIRPPEEKIRFAIPLGRKPDYYFTSRIGEGKEAEFYIFRDEYRFPFAVGVFANSSDEEVVKRAISQAQLNKTEFTPKVLDIGLAEMELSGETHPCIIYEYIDGTTGLDILQQGLNRKSLAKILHKVGTIVNKLHGKDLKLTIDDLKWSNILVSNTNENIYLMDVDNIYGIGSTQDLNKSNIKYTPNYITPSMAKANTGECLYTRTKHEDYWRLGIMCLIALSKGKFMTPFELSENFNDYIKSLPYLQEANKFISLDEDSIMSEYTGRVSELNKRIQEFFNKDNKKIKNYRRFNSAIDVINYLLILDE